MKIMDSKRALTIAGVVFLLMSLFGFFEVFGPGANNSIFGQGWWLDNAENYSHLAFGLIFLPRRLTAKGWPGHLD